MSIVLLDLPQKSLLLRPTQLLFCDGSISGVHRLGLGLSPGRERSNALLCEVPPGLADTLCNQLDGQRGEHDNVLLRVHVGCQGSEYFPQPFRLSRVLRQGGEPTLKEGDERQKLGDTSEGYTQPQSYSL